MSKAIEIHYIITVQTQQGMIHTDSGTLIVSVGYTRFECFGFILKQSKEKYGECVVLYFTMDPNQF